ncbi:hypothetical protein BG015_006616, partial [Linnemannia schmuckeri]
MAKNELDWIKARALEGLDWKAIKARLRLSKETMDKLEQEGTRGPIPPCMYMPYGDVRKAQYRLKIQDSRKSQDPTVS